MTDDLKKNTGTLNSWSLQFTREAMPMAPAGGASLQAQPFATVASTTTGVKPSETPIAAATIPSISSTNLLAAVVANDSAKGTAQQLAAATTTANENGHRDDTRQLAARDAAIATLGDRILDAFDFEL